MKLSLMVGLIVPLCMSASAFAGTQLKLKTSDGQSGTLSCGSTSVLRIRSRTGSNLQFNFPSEGTCEAAALAIRARTYSYSPYAYAAPVKILVDGDEEIVAASPKTTTRAVKRCVPPTPEVNTATDCDGKVYPLTPWPKLSMEKYIEYPARMKGQYVETNTVVDSNGKVYRLPPPAEPAH